MGKQSAGTKQTAQQRAQAEVAVQQLQDFRKRWMPLQQQMAETIVQTGGRDSFERGRARGMAATDTAAQFGAAQEKLRTQSEAAGMGGTARQKLGIAGLGDDASASQAFGLANADRIIDDAYIQGLGQVMALGRGEKATAMQGMSEIARRSGQQASADASMALANRAGNAQFAGQVLGMGLGAYGMGQQPAANFTSPNAAGEYANPAGDTYNFRGADLPTGLRAGG